jgi:TnpA family transposase
MATREVLSPAQRALLFKLPQNLSERELARYYTLSEGDLSSITRHRGSQNRIGIAVQLCLLRYPGQGLIVTDTVPQSVTFKYNSIIESVIHKVIVKNIF